jgi:hypothetical protein
MEGDLRLPASAPGNAGSQMTVSSAWRPPSPRAGPGRNGAGAVPRSACESAPGRPPVAAIRPRSAGLPSALDPGLTGRSAGGAPVVLRSCRPHPPPVAPGPDVSGASLLGRPASTTIRPRAVSPKNTPCGRDRVSEEAVVQVIAVHGLTRGSCAEHGVSHESFLLRRRRQPKVGGMRDESVVSPRVTLALCFRASRTTRIAGRERGAQGIAPYSGLRLFPVRARSDRNASSL